MAWAPLFTAVTGADLPDTVTDLPGFVLVAGTDEPFPSLRAGAGAVRGVLAERLTPDQRDRLGYFAAGLGYVRREVAVRDGDVKRTVETFAPAPPDAEASGEWDAASWQQDWGALVLGAAEEAMEHFGTVPPERLAWMMPMILVRAAARRAAAPGVPTEIRRDLRADDVTVEERHNRHAGFFLTREYLLRHPRFDGGMSPPVRREVFVATDAAIVLPYDPVRDRVLLVEQFRMGPYGRGDPYPWMLEPVAGRVDPGETPEETARRECVEEAGLTFTRLEHISSHYCSLGCSTEYFHCFAGLCDLPELATGQGGLDSEDEDIRTHILPFDQAVGLIATGEAANGPLVLCLLWLQRERQRLRAGA